VAGFGAGTVATLVMHPLDLVKVRFQLADAPSVSTIAPTASSSAGVGAMPNAEAGPSTGTARKPPLGRAVYYALSDAVKTDGWKGLYRGLVPNLVGGASSWGLYFLL
jgi:solute carrier family 25 folate transporter 32